MLKTVMTAFVAGPIAVFYGQVPVMAAETAEKAGMPQFDPSGFSSQIFWLAITFAFLLWWLSTKSLPRIGEVLERRQNTIEDDLTKARTLKEETDATIAGYERTLEEARDAAQAVIRDTMVEVARKRAEETDGLSSRIAGQLEDAEKRLRSAKDAAFAEVPSLAADIAREATDKLIGVRVQTRTARTAVENAAGE